jgi:hypothetical protein
MARQKCRFRQREVVRAIKAALAAGVEVDRFEINTDGKIVVHLHGSGGDDPKVNTADAVMQQLEKDKLKNEHGKK